MKKFSLILLVSLCSFTLWADEEKPLSIWALPQVLSRHNFLRQELAKAVRSGDFNMMEKVCRAGVAVVPGDPIWHYNLACALAYRPTPDAALDELERAITFGFRNAKAIAEDRDFTRLKDLPRFAELVEKARALADAPVPGRPTPVPRSATYGSTVTLAETNLVWNFDVGLYSALLQLKPSKTPLALQAMNFSKSKPTAPEVPYVAAWLSEGSSAGNAGDLYVNRDRNHSALALGDYPQLTSVRYPKEAQAVSADVNHPNALFPNPVFGNISRGITKGPYWRSMARHSFTEPNLAERMDTLYRNNQFWVIPCVNDYGKPGIGDLFPANAPFQCVSLGASWSDQPFLRAALAASASFNKVTKGAITGRHLMGPTLQWLLRSTLKGVTNETDYLSAKAHPTVFAASRLDTARLVQKAHALKPEQIPPATSLAFINSRRFPIHYPLAKRDFPDLLPELIFASPSAIAFMLRAPAGERTFLFRAQTYPEKELQNAVFTWHVVNGEPWRVKIEPPPGEALNTPSRGFAQITIDRRGLTNRLDVACFAKVAGATDWGAPSIISFTPVPLEVRTYRPDGKIAAIDYSNPAQNYCDPYLVLPRDWTDTYTYDKNGTCLGFTRSRNGTPTASFTPTGERIVSRTADGKPKQLVSVRYLTRRTGNDVTPVELTYTDDGEPRAAQE